jgi:transposase, IS5 family
MSETSINDARHSYRAGFERPNRQKDKDARWTKKHGKSFYGYKNHVNADAEHKLIRRYEVTDASVQDSRKFDGLLNKANTSADVYADSAYRSAEIEAKLKARGLRNREPQASAIKGAGEREPPEEQGSGSHRARVRCSANLTGRSDCTDDRHRAGHKKRTRNRAKSTAKMAVHRSGAQANDKIVIVRGAL